MTKFLIGKIIAAQHGDLRNHVFVELNMGEQAKLSLNIQGVTFEIAGSESFVTSEIERFREEISELLGKAARITAVNLDDDKIEPPPAPHQEPTGKPAFVNVLHLENDQGPHT